MIITYLMNDHIFMTNNIFLYKNGAHEPLDSWNAVLNFIFCFLTDYIIPIPGLAAGAGVSSLMIATADSVVSNVDATLVAF